jgi:hypothetical protein
MSDKTGVHYSESSVLWFRFEAVNSSVTIAMQGFLALQ